MKRWRISPNTLIIMCWLLYTSAYLGRYSFNSNITLIEQAFNVKHADSGLVTTMFFFAYGVGQVINGLFCKRYNKRIVLTSVLIISSLINFAVAFGLPFFLMKYMWLINGAVQSVLWSSIVSVLSEHLDKKNLKKAIIVMSTTTPVGTLLTYGVGALLSFSGNYIWLFLFGAVVMLVVSGFWFMLYDKKGLGTQEKETTDIQENKSESIGKKAIPLGLMICVIILAVYAIVDNLIKDGLQTWVPAILKENFSLTDSLSIILSVALPILGIFGAMLSNFIYKYIKDFVALSGLFFSVSAVSMFGVIVLLKTTLWLPILLLFGLTVMFTYGVNNIITSMMPMYSREKIDSGKIAGILNGFCYVGSTISAYGLGLVADSRGWNGVFTLLLIMCIAPVVISLISFIVSFFIKKKVK